MDFGMLRGLVQGALHPTASLARFLSSWQVSSYGRVQRPNGTVTWGSTHSTGYQRITIQGRQWRVHRLVMQAFHGPPADQHAWQVNHLDGNTTNNRLENLEYVTPKQNVHHSFKSASRGTAGPKLSMPVRCRPAGVNCWTYYTSMTEAAEALGMSRRSVSRSCGRGIVVKEYRFQKAAVDMFEDIEGEEWKVMMDPRTGYPIPEKLVSSLGRIKGMAGRISAGYHSKEGYCITTIRLDSEPRRRNVLVHQLVARAFLGPPPSSEHTQVNHKDGKKANNSVDNLEYVTPGQNVAHSYRITPIRTYSHVKPVESRCFGSQDRWRWHSSTIGAAKDLGVYPGNVRHCLAGRYKQTGGYEFRSLPPSPDLPGEQWRDVDVASLLEERSLRTSLG